MVVNQAFFNTLLGTSAGVFEYVLVGTGLFLVVLVLILNKRDISEHSRV